jgi:repressor LexA
MQPRTRRQKEVLDYILRYVENHGYVPSYQQIAWHLGVASKAGVAKHIEALESQGLISRRRENGCFSLDLRPVSTIAESVCEIEWLDVEKNEALAEDWEKERLFVPKFLLGYQTPERLRAYRVLNDAMLDEHICSGDVALIEKRSFARDERTGDRGNVLRRRASAQNLASQFASRCRPSHIQLVLFD